MDIYDKIALWLYEKISVEGYVSQVEFVADLIERFGDKYSYVNENGNLAADPKIYQRFRKLKKDDILWDRADFSWHKVTDSEREINKMLGETNDEVKKNLSEIQVEKIDIDDSLNIDLSDMEFPDIDHKIKF